MNNRKQQIEIFIKAFEKTCKRIIVKDFEKSDTITSYIKNRNQICLLKTGSAEIIRYNQNGEYELMDKLQPYDIFGEVFYKITQNNEFIVKAKKKSTVIFFDYDYLYFPCPYNCEFHKEITENFNYLIMEKITNTTKRIELVSKKTIRDKLLSYFDYLSMLSFSSVIEIPMSYEDLSSYLCINRSAMMKELKLLEDDKLIVKNKKKITILK